MKTKAVTPQIASSREGAILLSLEVQRRSLREHYQLNVERLFIRVIKWLSFI